MGEVKVLAVFDKKMGIFMTPWTSRSLGGAIRSFSDEANRAADDNQIYRHPEDFSLWHLANFDEENGIFNALEKGPTLLIEADQCAKEPL